MLAEIALWLAQELLKFAGARLFRGSLQAIFDRWDLDARTDERAVSPESMVRSMKAAVREVEGTSATPQQLQALRLIHDPVKAAEAFFSIPH